MEQVFSPGAIDWVERAPKNDWLDECIFCELPEKKADKESKIVARGKHAYVLLNNYPFNPGHAMVIPYEHTGEYQALNTETLLAKERLIQRTLDAIDESLFPDAYNIGHNLRGEQADGSLTEHFHAHIIPRWEGDTNFMSVISNTTIIAEAVDETYDRLHAAFRKQDGISFEGEDVAVSVEDA